MKQNNVFSKFFFAVAILSGSNAAAQSSYIGLNKTADYDYATRVGTITLDSFVKGSTKIIRQAKSLDAILVLDYSGSMTSSYTPKSGTQSKYMEATTITTKSWSDLGGGITTNTVKSVGTKTIGGVSRELFYYLTPAKSGMSNGHKWMFYVDGGSRYYLQPSGVVRKAKNTTNPTYDDWPIDINDRRINPVEQSTDVIWTEMTYTSQKISNRLKALKAGVNNFVDSIAVHNTNNEKHELSIIQFNSLRWPKFDYGNASDRAKYIDSSSDIYLREQIWHTNNNSQDASSSGGCSVLMKFNPLNSAETIQEAKNTLNTYVQAGNTAGDGGLLLARLLGAVNTSRSDTSKYAKNIVFFTDGDPNKNASSGFDTAAANDALEEAYQLKKAGYTIYTIYCGSSSDDSQTVQYVDYLSSNYPNARSMTNTGSPIATKKFAKKASDDLVDIFSSIAGEITASAGIQYGTETVMNDFINNTYFKLARTVDVSDPWASVDVFKVKCTGMTLPDSTRTFSTNPSDTVRLTSSDGIVINLHRATEEGDNDRISVRGFDYSKNWCGTQKDGTPHGWKLLVKVPFEFTGDDETVPSTVQTNEDGSGIYPAKTDSTGTVIIDPVTHEPVYDTIPEKPYISPTITFCRLKITRYNLDRGESAIYEVTHEGKFVARVSLNGTEDDFVSKILYGLPGGMYKVTETNWNWAYNKDPAWGWIEQEVSNADSLDPVNFVFRGTHKTGTGPEDMHNHDEEYKVNIIDVSDL